jgi:two-component system phosphate regulon sensor histidine kinase PhoR
MNVVAGELLDADPDGSIGRPIREITRASKVPDILSQALTRGESVTAEVMIVGTRRDCVMEAYASPLKDCGQATNGAVVVLHDVSELRRLESVRRDFVANVSHELKTPITAAQGLVETMLSDDEMDTATRHGFLERVRVQISRLASLVGDLLTLSRLESGKGTRADSPRDFREVIREKIAEFESAVSSKKLQVKLELSQSPLPIAADRDTLGQIFGNLFDNAIKYTEPEGHITVRLTHDMKKAVLEIADTGIGIEPMHQERIFERFYRVDKARSRELGGTGLGLAIVKHLVRGLRGQISVTSTLGEGSTFRVEVPLADARGSSRTAI